MFSKFNKNDFITGVEVIDQQHFKFLKFVENFFDNLNDRNTAVKLFNGLNSYIVYHFDCEEEIMNKFDYPLNKDHTGRHNYFRETIRNYSLYFVIVKNIDSQFKEELKKLLVEWLVNHITIEDKKLSTFIKELQINNPTVIELLDTQLLQFNKIKDQF